MIGACNPCSVGGRSRQRLRRRSEV